MIVLSNPTLNVSELKCSELEFKAFDLDHRIMIRVNDHPVPFAADFALGMRMLISASNGHCAYKDGSNCRVHTVLGAVIVAASLMDYILAIVCIHVIEQIFTQIDAVTRKVHHDHAPWICQWIITHHVQHVCALTYAAEFGTARAQSYIVMSFLDCMCFERKA
jgi:hypothetical protein